MDRHQDHAWRGDLLDQVATSEAERREVRRILGAGPLTEADLDRRERDRLPAPTWADDVWSNAFPACAGPCQQGHRLCPCPEACQRADTEDRSMNTASGVLLAVALGLACWCLIALAWILLS